MRFATRAGKYPRPKTPLRLTRALPRRAAAVMVHGADGSVATLCLDLDTSKAEQHVVDADAAGIASLLTSCGLRFVADHSPSGGRHIYVPLTKRLPAEQARELVEALAIRFTSLDPGPHRNITDGCIRPPGSLHKSLRGHQVLDTPLAQAYDILRRRNTASAVESLRHALAGDIHQLRQRRRNAAAAAGSSVGVLAEKTTARNAALRETARTGVYNRASYRSASEARLAVLTHLANYNLSLAQVRDRFATDLSGLASLYKDPDRAARLLPSEWAKAQARVAENPHPRGRRTSASLNYDTEPTPTHSGGTKPSRSAASVMAEINDVENVLYAVLDQRLAATGREGISLRMLLRAVIGFARSKKSLVIDVGCRSFALAMGKHHATVARLLPRLVRFTDGLVERIEMARGRDADVYLLTLPAKWKPAADALSWRRGKIHALRPVFWALGDVAALVYEAIERQRTPSTAAQIVRATGIGRTAVDQALTTMAELAMIERRHGTWRLVHTTSLTEVADWLGVQEVYEERKLRIKQERRQWQAFLERFSEPAIREEDLGDPEKDAYYSAPPDYADDPPTEGAPAAA